MNISEFFHTYSIPTYADYGIGIWQINPDIIRSAGTLQVMAHQLIIIKQGTLKTQVSQHQITITSGCFSDFAPYSKMTYLSASDDLQAWCIFIDEDFLFNQVFKQRPPINMNYVNYISSNYATSFPSDTLHSMQLLYQSINDTLSQDHHPLQQAILKLKLRVLYMEINVAFNKLIQSEPHHIGNQNRQQYIFTQFIHLLSNHALQQRTIEFYANELCITIQYLGRVVQSITHKTAGELISRTAIGQIELLLADQQLSLKQIALRAGFTDQAVFSKYYKRHTGITPSEYRKLL